MRNVASPIVRIVMISMGLRPSLSPKWPKSTPPTGRATKPTAAVLNEANTPATADDSGKNTAGKTSAAAVRYMKKSYHSMDDATSAARPAFVISDLGSSAPSPTIAICAPITQGQNLANVCRITDYLNEVLTEPDLYTQPLPRCFP